MGSDTESKKPCSDSLENEAFLCLDTFPTKIQDLNNIIDSFMPASIKNKNSKKRSHSTLSSNAIKDPEAAVNIQLNESSSFVSPTKYNAERGVYKKRSRTKIRSCSSLRHKSRPLGKLITFLATNIFKCTNSLIIAPSWYVLGKLVSLFSYGRFKNNAVCGSTESQNDSVHYFTPNAETFENSAITDFIAVVRPAAIQLISDIAILKKWLQALAMKTPKLPDQLSKAIRITETIDCWAYELFFTLKCFRANFQRNLEQVLKIGIKMNEDIEIIRLWHRLIQLRNNYIILHETLRKNEKIHENSSAKLIET